MTGLVATKVAIRSGFFLYMSLGFLAVALIGFSPTLFLPLARGTFADPHGVPTHHPSSMCMGHCFSLG